MFMKGLVLVVVVGVVIVFVNSVVEEILFEKNIFMILSLRLRYVVFVKYVEYFD